jgi:hypothetical protein
MARLLIELDDGSTLEVVDDLEKWDLGMLPAAASLLQLLREAKAKGGISFPREDRPL